MNNYYDYEEEKELEKQLADNESDVAECEECFSIFSFNINHFIKEGVLSGVLSGFMIKYTTCYQCTKECIKHDGIYQYHTY